MIEWTITVGNLFTSAITLLGFVVAAITFFHAIRSTLNLQSERLLMLSGRMINVENEIKELKLVLIQMATQETSLKLLSERVDRLQTDASQWHAYTNGRLDKLTDELVERRNRLGGR